MPEAWQRPAAIAAGTGVALLMGAAALAFDVAPTPERQAELLHRLRHDCGSCHGMTMKGGLGPALLPLDLDGKDIDFLASVVRDGVPGTPMPPWDFELSQAEARWIVTQLKQGLPP